MLILRLFRYLLGYVRFAAWGGFPERFINLCEHNRILLKLFIIYIQNLAEV